MEARSEPTFVLRGYSTAVRRFPQFEFAIRRLMSRSETFCDMCEELAEAEQALANVSAAPPALVAARRTEWQELVDRLVGEIETALQQSQAWQTRLDQ